MMTKLFLYLLESSAIMAILYALYLIVLRRETFFNLNRFYLIGILVISLSFPLLSFDINPSKVEVVERPITEISNFRMSYYEALEAWEFDSRNMTGSSEKTNLEELSTYSRVDWINIAPHVLLVIYAIGMIVCLSRTFWTARWIWKMVSLYPNDMIKGLKVVKVPYPISPFSFLKYVFVHEANIYTPEFEQILAHEKTHVQQRHSIDLIFVQLLAAFLWFNPVIWRLIKSLKTTHEYIADKKIINTGYSLVEYQTLLLRQLISNNSHGLVHNFNLTFIKKRITMMKIQKSGWAGRARVAIVLSTAIVLSLIIVQCNSTIDEKTTIQSEKLVVADFSAGVNLPVLPKTGYQYDGDLSNALNLVVTGDRLTIDGQVYQTDEIGAVIENSGLNESGIVIMRIDQAQNMSLVGDIHMELRKANRRKLLYIGRTDDGEKVELPFLLPPPPGVTSIGVPLPVIDEEYIALHNISILEIDLDQKSGIETQNKVNDFVRNQIKESNSNYIVSAKFNNLMIYGDYLNNLTHIQEAFDQIYEERSKEMFGKSFYDFNKKNAEEKAQYDAVRRGIPRAISIAERESDISM